MNTTRATLLLLAVTLIPVLAGEHDILVKCTIAGEKEMQFATTKTPVNVSQTDEVPFATEWDLPKETTNSEGHAIVVPVTPLAFERMNAGWELRCSAVTVGDLIRLTGTATFTEAEFTKGVFGEKSGPIYSPEKKKVMLTPNESKTASVLSSTSHFQLFAIPGKEYEIKVRRLNKWVTCRITCDF